MKSSKIPELAGLSESERRRVLVAVAPEVFKDFRVLGAYAAQILGFLIIFFVLFPAAQPRLVLILAYAIPTMWLAGGLHRRIARERIVAFLEREKSTHQVSPAE